MKLYKLHAKQPDGTYNIVLQEGLHIITDAANINNPQTIQWKESVEKQNNIETEWKEI